MEPEKDLNEVIEEVTVNNPTMTATEESVVVEEKPVTPDPVTPEAPKADGPVFADKPKKKGAGVVLGMVLLALLAAGGIGFGVWAMMDKNTEVDRLNKQITELQNQSVDYGGGTIIDEETVVDIETNASYLNPVISSQSEDGNYTYTVWWVSSSRPERIRLMLQDGKISSCSLETETTEGSWSSSDCNVAVEGDIYKVESFGGTQENDPYIGFIMRDGSVKYFSFYDAINNNDFTIRDLNIDGFVADIVKLGAGPTNAPVGGFITNAFVMRDGTYKIFDEAMVE